MDFVYVSSLWLTFMVLILGIVARIRLCVMVLNVWIGFFICEFYVLDIGCV